MRVNRPPLPSPPPEPPRPRALLPTAWWVAALCLALLTAAALLPAYSHDDLFSSLVSQTVDDGSALVQRSILDDFLAHSATSDDPFATEANWVLPTHWALLLGLTLLLWPIAARCQIHNPLILYPTFIGLTSSIMLLALILLFARLMNTEITVQLGAIATQTDLVLFRPRIGVWLLCFVQIILLLAWWPWLVTFVRRGFQWHPPPHAVDIWGRHRALPWVIDHRHLTGPLLCAAFVIVSVSSGLEFYGRRLTLPTPLPALNFLLLFSVMFFVALAVDRPLARCVHGLVGFMVRLLALVLVVYLAGIGLEVALDLG